MEPTKENFDIVNNQLSIARTLIISKYSNELNEKQTQELNHIFDKRIIQLMPKFKNNMSIQAAYFPVLERAAEIYIQSVRSKIFE